MGRRTRHYERLRVVPGELRSRDVKVGRHIAISPGAVPRFLTHFESIYSRVGKTDAILALRRRTTASCGYIRFSTAMAA